MEDSSGSVSSEEGSSGSVSSVEGSSGSVSSVKGSSGSVSSVEGSSGSVSSVEGSSGSVSPLTVISQPAKMALNLSYVSVLLNWTCFRLVQPEKAFAPIDSTLSGIRILSSFAQKENAESSIVLRLSGKLILSRPDVDENA